MSFRYITGSFHGTKLMLPACRHAQAGATHVHQVDRRLGYRVAVSSQPMGTSALRNCFKWRTVYLTPWSRILLEKLVVAQQVRKFPTFYGRRMSITMLTKVRH
jgi:hypothetical protein